jgi:hypothetical protein
MAQTIVLPRQQQYNPYLGNLQNMLFQMLMSKASAAARSQEIAAAAKQQEARDIRLGVIRGDIKEYKTPSRYRTGAGERGVRTFWSGGKLYQAVPKSAKPTKPGTIKIYDPKTKKEYHHSLIYGKDGGLKVGKRLGQVKPTTTGVGAGKTTMPDRKLQVWEKYMKTGKITSQEMEFIGLDKDPNLARAAQLVLSDPKFMFKSVDITLPHIMRIKEALDAGREKEITGQIPEKVVDPLGWFGGQGR